MQAANHTLLAQWETINRLLKKQSRPRNKRNALATADDRTPATPNEGEEEDGSAEFVPPVPEIPTSYRWISTSRLPSSTPGEHDLNVPPTEPHRGEGPPGEIAI